MNALDHFGQFLMQHLRDEVVDHYDKLVEGAWKAPSLQHLQHEVGPLSPEHVALMRRCLLSALDSGIHDLLFALQEQADSDNRIGVQVDDVDVIAASDGLHGELFTEDGWFARFSKHGERSGDA